MQYVVMAITGLIVGILARFIYPGAISMSLIASMVLGILGSLLAGVAMRAMNRNAADQTFHPAGIIASILGAMILIFLARNVLHIV